MTTHAWLSVLVIPVNSALDPLLYSLTTLQFRRTLSQFCSRVDLIHINAPFNMTTYGKYMKFCLPKGSLFGPKSGLHKGPFLQKIEVSPLKNACFANFCFGSYYVDLFALFARLNEAMNILFKSHFIDVIRLNEI